MDLYFHRESIKARQTSQIQEQIPTSNYLRMMLDCSFPCQIAYVKSSKHPHCTVFELYLNQIIYSHIAYIWRALIANDRLINVELTSAGRDKAKSCLYLVLEQPVIHHQVAFLRSSTQYEDFEADVQ